MADEYFGNLETLRLKSRSGERNNRLVKEDTPATEAKAKDLIRKLNDIAKTARCKGMSIRVGDNDDVAALTQGTWSVYLIQHPDGTDEKGEPVVVNEGFVIMKRVNHYTVEIIYLCARGNGHRISHRIQREADENGDRVRLTALPEPAVINFWKSRGFNFNYPSGFQAGVKTLEKKLTNWVKTDNKVHELENKRRAGGQVPNAAMRIAKEARDTAGEAVKAEITKMDRKSSSDQRLDHPPMLWIEINGIPDLGQAEEEVEEEVEEKNPVLAADPAVLQDPPAPRRDPPAPRPQNRPRGAQGRGRVLAKRHRKVLRDNIQGITKPAIRRLARRGGVKRLSGLIYEETRGVLKVFLEQVIRDAVTYTEHARRKTVTAMDVVYALKRQGRTLYGFGG